MAMTPEETAEEQHLIAKLQAMVHEIVGEPGGREAVAEEVRVQPRSARKAPGCASPVM